MRRMTLPLVALMSCTMIACPIETRAQETIRHDAARFDQRCGDFDLGRQLAACIATAAGETAEGAPLKLMLIYRLLGEPRLRAELPANVQTTEGVRFFVDGEHLGGAAPVGCATVCEAQYDLMPGQYARLERGRLLTMRATRVGGSELTFEVQLPQMIVALNDAAAAYLRAKRRRAPGSSSDTDRILDDTLDQKHLPQREFPRR